MPAKPFEPLPFDAGLDEYRRQAEGLLRDGAALDQADAELTVARRYDFGDWGCLAQYVDGVSLSDSPVHRFEAAVEAVVGGDLAGLGRMLVADPNLVMARSARVTHFDPPVHRATLLNYLAANGVEGHRQRTPPNAVAIATLLLDAGAEVDALADLYGGQCTTMSLLVSSAHPAAAGLQIPLAETLLDHGAALEPRGSGNWTSPLMTALAFGYTEVADMLVRRGAQVATVAAAAALGRVDLIRQLLPGSDSVDRRRGLALAAQHGRLEAVRLLLDAGEDPDRYNPEGNHRHSTPLHQAVWSGQLPVVRLLVERGARVDIRDTVHDGTALDWALHGKRTEVAGYLRGR